MYYYDILLAKIDIFDVMHNILILKMVILVQNGKNNYHFVKEESSCNGVIKDMCREGGIKK